MAFNGQPGVQDVKLQVMHAFNSSKNSPHRRHFLGAVHPSDAQGNDFSIARVVHVLLNGK